MHNNSNSSGNNLNADLATRIQSVRTALGLTQSQFAEKCDLSTSYVAAIETCCKGVGLQTLYKICNATNISADYFLFGKSQFSSSFINNSLDSLDSSIQPHVVNIIRELFEISTKHL